MRPRARTTAPICYQHTSRHLPTPGVCGAVDATRAISRPQALMGMRCRRRIPLLTCTPRPAPSQIGSPARPAHTCCSTPLTRRIGMPGARRRWSAPASSTGPSSCRSGMPPATGVTSCIANRSQISATAQDLNAGFVSIKVDREERPDVDSLYMDAVQSLTGSGGWPMSVFLTPDGRPFYGGTYFPDAPRHGLASFRQVLSAVREAWLDRRQEVEQSATRLADAIAQGQRAPHGHRDRHRRYGDRRVGRSRSGDGGPDGRIRRPYRRLGWFAQVPPADGHRAAPAGASSERRCPTARGRHPEPRCDGRRRHP